MSTAAIVGGTLAAGVATSAIGSSAATSAASTQAAAATSAQQLQATEAANALNFQQQTYDTGQANEAPYLAAGATGLNALQYGLGTGGTANGSGVGQGSLVQAYPGGPFVAPTAADALNAPGVQAQLQLGDTALQNSAAARGSVLTGGTAKALDTYGQQLASESYQNVYNNALNSYNMNLNAYTTNQTNQYNKLAGMAGAGQATAANTAQQGQAAANATSNIDLTTGAQQGTDLQNAGTATASGYIGSANAINSGITGATNNLSNLALLSGSGYGTSGAGGASVPAGLQAPTLASGSDGYYTGGYN